MSNRVRVLVGESLWCANGGGAVSERAMFRFLFHRGHKMAVFEKMEANRQEAYNRLERYFSLW